ncbi:MAG: beta-ketoacyl-ACP synthase III [Actinomycetota bacterium]
MLTGAAVTGWGTALPTRELTNEELAPQLGLTDEWIFERTGIRSRRVVGPGETTSSLAIAAGAAALERARLAPEDLNMIVLATCTPDLKMPATAPLVQHALGAPNAAAYDLNAACSGFVYALAQASALIDARAARRVLVIGADVLTTVTDYSDPKSCVIFGDGAGALVLEAKEGPTRLGPWQLGSEGSQPELLWIPAATGLIEMQGREVYRRAVEGMTASVQDTLACAGLTVSDVDLLVAHQANARILEAVGARLGIAADKVALNIAYLGNTSAASIPIALGEAADAGRLGDDDCVVVTTFGAGFTWGTGVLQWGAPVDEGASLALAGEIRG